MRAALIAACKAAAPLGFDAWAAAVRALGRASQAGFAVPKKPGRATGLTRTQLYARLLKSHLFDTDPAAWATVNPWASAAEMDALLAEHKARQRAEIPHRATALAPA